MKKLILSFTLGALVAGGVVALFWPGDGRSHVEVVVGPGMAARRVAADLVDAGAVRSARPFLAWLKVRGAGGRIKVGRYRIARGRSAYWIADDMIKGRTEKERVVIPEGFASWQIATRLESRGICSGEGFLRVVAERDLEGFLFPATYAFDVGLRPERVAAAMAREFEDRWTDAFTERSRELGFTRREVVTFASIVQREVRVLEEAPRIAAVYHNRLRRGWRLEADPTVQFAKGYWKERLLYRDYRETDSPYNTYLHNGLPPGPISNPGLDAIRATLWPAETNEMFLLATEDGRHDFSVTLREHQAKVTRRNQLRRAR